jgi:predicted aldo/keto reductase-like oxidoreductase
MEYMRFGRTNVDVSRIGFGGATAGLKNYLRGYDPQSDAARENIHKAIKKAVELGINYFDTAPGYGNGLSEEMFGEALDGVAATENGKPIFLATKVGLKDADNVRVSLEGSLQRLRKESVDLLQIHGMSYTDEMTDDILKKEGMLDQMVQLKEEGLTKFIGFTSEDNNTAVYRFIQTGMFDMMQLCYNFISQHPYIPSRPFGSLYAAEKAGMGISVMRAPTSGSFQKWIQMVNPANTFDYTRALIQFVLSNPLVDVALIGMRSPERVIQNVDICEHPGERVSIDELYTWYV